MAYKNLVAEPFSSRYEAFKIFRDWMCKRNTYATTGLGWTLHDSVYATDENNITEGDYFVMYSVGESGTTDIYVKVEASATINYNRVTTHLYWNAATHTGITSMTAVSNWYMVNLASGTLYVYANMNSFLVGSYNVAIKYACLCGILNSLYDQEIVVSASVVTAGSNVVVTLPSIPTSWVVGGHVVIKDNANIERLTISAISGLDVTFTTVAASYAAGCKLAQDYAVACSSTNSLIGTYNILFSHDGTKNDSFAASALPVSPGTSGDPDPLNGDFLATVYPIKDITGGYMGYFDNILMCSTTGFTDLAVYSDGTDYHRAFISYYNSVPLICKEV
jgi:hypothetical protein